MSYIPQDTIDKVIQIPLYRVMEHFGFEQSHKTDKEIFYNCPFHAEQNASFKVDRTPNYKQKEGAVSLAGFYCYACSEQNPRSKGYGAIMLWAAIENIDLSQSGNLQLVINKLAKLDNLVIDGDFLSKHSVISPLQSQSAYPYCSQEYNICYQISAVSSTAHSTNLSS